MEFPLAAIRGLARKRRQPMSTSAMTRDEMDEAACWLVAARLDGRLASACPLAPRLATEEAVAPRWAGSRLARSTLSKRFEFSSDAKSTRTVATL